MDEYKLKPIGFFRSPFKNFLEAPRQPTHEDPDSFIELLSKNQFEQALKDLDGFERIWVIFPFHLKSQWRPQVMPPRGSSEKRGVFSTRSPLRPNHLGLSCLQLVKIIQLKVFVSGSDLLDGTPIFDIKPYLPYTDSFPQSKTGWLEGVENERWQVHWHPTTDLARQWLLQKGLPLDPILMNQLEFDPTNSEKKRVRPTAMDNEWVFAYRTWRIYFTILSFEKTLVCSKIETGYSKEELQDLSDPYKDKSLHKEFIEIFQTSKAI